LSPRLKAPDGESCSCEADVRKLKELGLTESLEVGYRLSPRGRALLARLGAAAPSPDAGGSVPGS
jgi:hypothetical protein